jgi:hypothetical protein
MGRIASSLQPAHSGRIVRNKRDAMKRRIALLLLEFNYK